jgi:hypothetical protein
MHPIEPPILPLVRDPIFSETAGIAGDARIRNFGKSPLSYTLPRLCRAGVTLRGTVSAMGKLYLLAEKIPSFRSCVRSWRKTSILARTFSRPARDPLSIRAGERSGLLTHIAMTEAFRCACG